VPWKLDDPGRVRTGHLFEDEWYVIRDYAKLTGKIIALSGSLSESLLGRQRREMALQAHAAILVGDTPDPEHLKQLIAFLEYAFRALKLSMGLMHGRGDVDLWEGPPLAGSNPLAPDPLTSLSDAERRDLWKSLNAINELMGRDDFHELDPKGYSLKRYGDEQAFERMSGAIVFDGTTMDATGEPAVYRIFAPWQRHDWPNIPERIRLRPGDVQPSLTDTPMPAYLRALLEKHKRSAP
jgi:hypothetical protein